MGFPQKPPDLDIHGNPVKPPDLDVNGNPIPAQPEQSWGDWAIETGLRTIPPVVGGIAGTLMGGPVGGMAGGGGGAVLGDIAAQLYSGKPYNPVATAVEGVTGAIPPIFGPVKAPAATGLKELAKYALKSGGLSAIEGAAVNTAATPFQYAAQTGSFDAPWEQYAQNAAGGAVFGGTLGTAFGAHHGRGEQAKLGTPTPTPDATVPPPPPPPTNAAPSSGPQLQPEFRLPFPQDPSQVGELKKLGYKLSGIDPSSKEMVFVPKAKPKAAPPAGPIHGPERPMLGPEPPMQGPELPMQGPEPPMYGPETPPPGPQQGKLSFGEEQQDLFAQPQTPPQGPNFAFFDPHNFARPEPFYHLPNGSTVSSIEAIRRGINPPEPPAPPMGRGDGSVQGRLNFEIPQDVELPFGMPLGGRPPTQQELPFGAPPEPPSGQGRLPFGEPPPPTPELSDEQLGIGRQYPGVETQDVGAMPNQEIDLNQAVYEMGSDMATPVQGRPIMDPMQAQRNLEHQLQTIEEGPVMPGQQPTQGIPPPVLPHEFQPDIPMTREPVEGGYSPKFGQQVSEQIPPTDEGPLWAREGNWHGSPPSSLGNLGKDRTNLGVQEMNVRAKVLKAGIQKAYRDGDMNTVIDLSQQLDEINKAREGGRPGTNPNRYDYEPLEAQEPPKGIGGRLRDAANKLRGQSPDQLMDPNAAKQELENLITGGENIIETQIKADVTHTAKELTSGYNRAMPAVMTREGIQNSLDAFVNMPGTRGEIKVVAGADGLTVSDNGIGMSPEELKGVFTTLHGSGKRTQEGAKGGKGVGKATYMLGGTHFEVTTVKEINGKKIQSTFQGEPETFFDKIRIGFKEVDPDTPTGTTFTTKFDKTYERYGGQSRAEAANMLDDIEKWSRGLEHNINQDQYGFAKDMKLKDKSNDISFINKEIGNGVANVEVLIPEGEKTRQSSWIEVHYLNDGFFQFSKTLNLDEAHNGMPENIIVDLKSLVPETDPRYPFPVQRESIKGNLQSEVDNLIKQELVNPLANKKKIDLAKLWNQMQPVDNPSGTRPTVFFDQGDRLTPQERSMFENSPIIKGISQEIDRILEGILASTGNNAWRSKLERVGIILSNPGHYGIHIPNPMAPPDAPKSAIFMNPFAHLNRSPIDAAVDMVVTLLHEAAHVGTENPVKLPKFNPEDLNDPRVGRYMLTYMNEVQTQGGIDYGHGMAFVHRLGEVYATYGTRQGLESATRIQRIIQDPITGGYRPEVQELLRIHTEARGRTPTTEDILSGTGVNSADGRSGGQNVGDDSSGYGGGTVRIRKRYATAERIAQIEAQGYEWEGVEGNHVIFSKPNPASPNGPPPNMPPPPTGGTGGPPSSGGLIPPKKGDPNEPGWKTDLYNAPRTILASVDLSAPLRQGIGLIHKKEFYKAFYSMVKAGFSEKSYQNLMSEIENRPMFKRRIDPLTGKELPSFAEDTAGLRMSDLNNSREEMIASRLVGSIPGVKHSNRAYTAFLNKLRADTFESLINQGKVFGADGTSNIPLAQEIAKFVNIATGRGPLGNLEASAKALNYGLFAPRLISSRLQVLNPHYYWAANPFVRKEAIKSLFAIAATGGTVLGLGKLAGGEVSSDPSNSDFMKLKIGNTRIDPWGGFQQYFTAVNRLLNPLSPALGRTMEENNIPGSELMGNTPFTRGQMVTSSSNPENEYDLWNPEPGPFDPNTGSVAGRFLRGKVHPVLGFAWSLFGGGKELSGEKMKFGLDPSTPQSLGSSAMENAIIQRAMPIFLQDLYELSENDELPAEMKPLLATLGMFGMGQQTYTPKGSEY